MYIYLYIYICSFSSMYASINAVASQIHHQPSWTTTSISTNPLGCLFSFPPRHRSSRHPQSARSDVRTGEEQVERLKSFWISICRNSSMQDCPYSWCNALARLPLWPCFAQRYMHVHIYIYIIYMYSCFKQVNTHKHSIYNRLSTPSVAARAAALRRTVSPVFSASHHSRCIETPKLHRYRFCLIRQWVLSFGMNGLEWFCLT